MGRNVVVALLAIAGVLCAAGVGFAAYIVSRDSVAVPVTQLQPKPQSNLTPGTLRTTTADRSTPKTGTRETRTTTTRPTTTVDDHGGRGRGGGGDDGSGSGSGHGSGRGSGGGGHGGDD